MSYFLTKPVSSYRRVSSFRSTIPYHAYHCVLCPIDAPIQLPSLYTFAWRQLDRTACELAVIQSARDPQGPGAAVNLQDEIRG